MAGGKDTKPRASPALNPPLLRPFRPCALTIPENKALRYATLPRVDHLATADSAASNAACNPANKDRHDPLLGAVQLQPTGGCSHSSAHRRPLRTNRGCPRLRSC